VSEREGPEEHAGAHGRDPHCWSASAGAWRSEASGRAAWARAPEERLETALRRKEPRAQQATNNQAPCPPLLSTAVLGVRVLPPGTRTCLLTSPKPKKPSVSSRQPGQPRPLHATASSMLYRGQGDPPPPPSRYLPATALPACRFCPPCPRLSVTEQRARDAVANRTVDRTTQQAAEQTARDDRAD